MENLWQNSLSCGHCAPEQILGNVDKSKRLIPDGDSPLHSGKLLSRRTRSAVNCVIFAVISWEAGDAWACRAKKKKKKKISPRQAICRGIPRSYEIISLTSFHFRSRLLLRFYAFVIIISVILSFSHFNLNPIWPCYDSKLNKFQCFAWRKAN